MICSSVGCPVALCSGSWSRLSSLRGVPQIGHLPYLADGKPAVAERPSAVHGGTMSDQPFDVVEKKLVEIRAAAKEMGCTLPEPYLLLAFLPLSVIPHLKITDKGLVDVDQFALVEAFA